MKKQCGHFSRCNGQHQAAAAAALPLVFPSPSLATSCLVRRWSPGLSPLLTFLQLPGLKRSNLHPKKLLPSSPRAEDPVLAAPLPRSTLSRASQPCLNFYILKEDLCRFVDVDNVDNDNISLSLVFSISLRVQL